MIRKLRVKFILVSMLSVLLVLTVILGIVNILNYQGIVHDADSVLALLSGFSGQLPVPEQAMEWQSAGERYKSPELPYEIRFFSAVVDAQGEVTSINAEQIFAVDESAAAGYALAAYESGAASGFVQDYRFARHEAEGGALITFLDCGRILTGFRSVLLTSIGISAAGMAAVFVLVWLLSGRMIRPIAESYRKQKRFIFAGCLRPQNIRGFTLYLFWSIIQVSLSFDFGYVSIYISVLSLDRAVVYGHNISAEVD